MPRAAQGALRAPRLRLRAAREYAAPAGIPDLRLAAADERTEAVREFYSRSALSRLPAARQPAGRCAPAAERSEFARLLDHAIPGDARVLEVGCGTGQMSLFLAQRRSDRGRRGFDARLARAGGGGGGALRRRPGSSSRPTSARPGSGAAPSTSCYSSGVLHHTPDPRASFAAVARLARPGGVVVLGLYNVYARLPHRLRAEPPRGSRGFRCIPFDPVLRDRRAEPARREAWLRDQYLHPEEHRHTLGEVQRWFRENGVEYVRAYPSALLAGDEPDSSPGDGRLGARVPSRAALVDAQPRRRRRPLRRGRQPLRVEPEPEDQSGRRAVRNAGAQIIFMAASRTSRCRGRRVPLHGTLIPVLPVGLPSTMVRISRPPRTTTRRR